MFDSFPASPRLQLDGRATWTVEPVSAGSIPARRTMNKARRRLQKQRRARRKWEMNFSFAERKGMFSGVETSESIQRSTKVTKILLDGKAPKPRSRKV
jgi:hypothetical protein